MDDRRRYLGAVAKRRTGEAGLTLIELLVVMAILALAASVVVMNAPPAKPPAREAAEVFAARVQTAFANAVIESAPYRLEVGAAGYLISRFRDGEWETRSRVDFQAVEDDLTLRVETTTPEAGNALALNGAAPAALEGDDDILLAPLDPYGGGPSINAHFESRRGNWTVSIASDGSIVTVRQ